MQISFSQTIWVTSSLVFTVKPAFDQTRATGVTIGFDDPVAYVRAFGEKMPHARPSMLLDHLAGRHSEIDHINGAIPRLGAEVGVPAPVNEVVSALVRGLEEGFG